MLTSFVLQSMLTLAGAYNKSVQEESTLSVQELKTRHVGKQDPKRHLEDAVEQAMGRNILQSLGTAMQLVSLTFVAGGECFAKKEMTERWWRW